MTSGIVGALLPETLALILIQPSGRSKEFSPTAGEPTKLPDFVPQSGPQAPPESLRPERPLQYDLRVPETQRPAL